MLEEKIGTFSAEIELDSDVDMGDGKLEESDEGEGDELRDTTPGNPLKPDALPRSASGKMKTARGRNERVIPAEECRAHLRRLFRNEHVLCSLLFGQQGPHASVGKDGLSKASADMFFLDVIPVAPTRFRPPAKLGDTLFEHPQNELLAHIISTSYRIRDLNVELKDMSVKDPHIMDSDRKRVLNALLERLVQLQIDVNSFMDSNKNPQPVRQGKLPPAGVKQGLEKKEGLFRKNMMVCFNDHIKISQLISTW